MSTKYKVSAILLLLAAELFSACGIIPYTLPPSIPPPPPHFEFLYATGFRQILEMKLDPSTGALSAATATPGPNTALSTTATMAADPAGKFLFVYDTENEAIDVFSIDPVTSALTEVGGSPFSAAGIGAPGGLAMDNSGRFLHVAGVFGIDVFVINAKGALTLVPGSPFLDNNGPLGVLTAPSTKFIYAADIGQGQAATISGFSVNSTTGALTAVPGSPFSTLVNGSAFYLAAHPSGKFLYAGIPSTRSIEAWKIDSVMGTLTMLPGFPLALSSGNNASLSSIVADPSGKFLYVSDDFGDIFGFTVNASNGALTAMPGSPFFAFFITDQLFVDPTGRFLYSPAGPFISGFSIDATTGVPTPLSGSPFPAGAGLAIPATLAFTKGSS
jgi:6-phosphogluconolactonase